MIADFGGGRADADLSADIAVVGSGPAGITVALEVASRGKSVILVESGARSFDRDLQDLSEAAARDVDVHAPMSLATRRQLGGTSVIWGGRCVPYDPVDFETRDVTDRAHWPLGYEDIEPYLGRACDWMKCGQPAFDARVIPGLSSSIVPGFKNGYVRASDLERWSLPTNFGEVYESRLEHSSKVQVLTRLTCTRIVYDSDASEVLELECRTHEGARVTVSARQYVLAAGGLESTRLLLSSATDVGRVPGNHSDLLGRFYMAHTEGVISSVAFSTAPKDTVYGYERDRDGTYVRRRFTFAREHQIKEGLPNIAAWITNPEISDASHESGPLSFAYLVLKSPAGRYLAPEAQRLALTGAKIPGTPYGGVITPSAPGQHCGNVLRHPLDTASFAAGFGFQRFLARGRRAPGFFVQRRNNVYPLQFHGEHIPNRESRVVLSSTDRDHLGRSRLDIDLRFSESDVDGVVRAHQEWDRYFRELGIGQLVYHARDVHKAVRRRLGGGFHQIGTTRMSAGPEGGVVDRNLTVYGVRNLHVVSSSVFVTSGQANSTLMIVALAVRFAEHVSGLLRPRAVQTDGP